MGTFYDASVRSEDMSRSRSACSRSLEQIARATLGDGYQVGGVVAREACELLDCEVALVLGPGDHAESVAVAGFASKRNETRPQDGTWRLGAKTQRLFERPAHTADELRPPWSELSDHLRGLGMRCWRTVPLLTESEGEAVGVLAAGSEQKGQPCRQMDRLQPLAHSSARALSQSRSDGLLPVRDRSAKLLHLESVNDLVFGVSHTLANIFGAILGNLHFLREEVTGQSCEDLLDRLRVSTDDGIDLMRSLQELTTVCGCREMAPVDLSTVAHEVVRLLGQICSPWAECRGVSLEVDAPGRCEVWGDAGRLRVVLASLVFNAIRAVGDDGRVQIIARACESEAGAELCVRDNGRGMSDEVMRRATEPFFTTEPGTHQGLGLTIARGVAVAHHGTLSLTRVVPGGIEATLRLPLTPPQMEQSERAIVKALSDFTSDAKGEAG